MKMERLKYIIILTLKYSVIALTVGFVFTVPTAGLLGSFYDQHELKEILGGYSALPIYFVWVQIILAVLLFKQAMQKGLQYVKKNTDSNRQSS